MRLTRSAAVAAVTVLAVGLSGPAAEARTQTRAMHRGIDGCIAWSYSPGSMTTTVYLHNQCDSPRIAKIAWKWSGLKTSEIRLDGDAKTHEQRRSDVDSIWDAGAA